MSDDHKHRVYWQQSGRFLQSNVKLYYEKNMKRLNTIQTESNPAAADKAVCVCEESTLVLKAYMNMCALKFLVSNTRK